MKIAIITELFAPSMGGQEVRYQELGSQLIQDGHDVHIYTVRLSLDDPKFEIVNGVHVHRITKALNYKTSFWGSRNFSAIVRFTKDIVCAKGELELFDLLIFNKWPLLPPIVYPRLSRKICLVDWCEIRPTKMWHLIYKMMANKNIKHIGVSQAICNHLESIFNIPPKQLSPILSGIYSNNYSSSICEKKDKSILFFGRLSDHKDPIVLIESFIWGSLAEKGYTLHIAGGGPLLTDINAKYLGTAGIYIHGLITDEMKVELLKQCTLLVLPSKREGFPRVIAEAAAAGTPTLTTEYPGNGSVSVVRQYQIGWTCKPRIDELASFVEKHAVITDEWHLISKNCTIAGKEVFSWNTISEQLMKFIGE